MSENERPVLYNMTKPVLYDVTHTSHCEANSGIQRVVRKLARHWPASPDAAGLLPVAYDHYAKSWRELDAAENRNLHFDEGRSQGARRGASWSFRQCARGRAYRALTSLVPRPPEGAAAFVCAELFTGDPRCGGFSQLRQTLDIRGPLIAVVHDTIALQMPEFTPARTVADYRQYLDELKHFDIIAANSEDTRDRLVEYWTEAGGARTPRVLAVPLGVDPVAGAAPLAKNAASGDAPLVLSVGTLEARKNHPALLDACERLWSAGRRFRLRLIGMLNRETGAEAAEKIASLQAKGRPIEWLDKAGDRTLFDSYAECDFTVYPSLYEGFGLPVLESLAHGRACVCSGLSAMAEIVRDGGGCVAIGEPTAENIARGMDALLSEKGRAVELSHAALRRKIRTWQDYARDIARLTQ